MANERAAMVEAARKFKGTGVTTKAVVASILEGLDTGMDKRIQVFKKIDSLREQGVSDDEIFARVMKALDCNCKDESKDESNKTTESVKTLEVEVSDILREIGVPAHIKGHKYVRTAIIKAVEEPKVLESVTKILYPDIARQFGTTASRVERAIRHGIEVAWDRGNIDVLQKYFGYTILDSRGKPTNSEFVAMIADKINLKSK